MSWQINKWLIWQAVFDIIWNSRNFCIVLRCLYIILFIIAHKVSWKSIFDWLIFWTRASRANKGCFEFKGTFKLKWWSFPHFMPANSMAYLCIKESRTYFWCVEWSCNFNKWLSFNYAKEMADMEKLPNTVHISHTIHDIIAWKLFLFLLSSFSLMVTASSEQMDEIKSKDIKYCSKI